MTGGRFSVAAVIVESGKRLAPLIRVHCICSGSHDLQPKFSGCLCARIAVELQRMKPTLLISLLAFALATVCRAHVAGEEMAAAANKFLESLTPEQRAKATFDFKNEERSNWYFIPKVRQGLTLKSMTPEQRQLAHALVSLRPERARLSEGHEHHQPRTRAQGTRRPARRDGARWRALLFLHLRQTGSHWHLGLARGRTSSLRELHRREG